MSFTSDSREDIVREPLLATSLTPSIAEAQVPAPAPWWKRCLEGAKSSIDIAGSHFNSERGKIARFYAVNAAVMARAGFRENPWGNLLNGSAVGGLVGVGISAAAHLGFGRECIVSLMTPSTEPQQNTDANSGWGKIAKFYASSAVASAGYGFTERPEVWGSRTNGAVVGGLLGVGTAAVIHLGHGTERIVGRSHRSSERPARTQIRAEGVTR